MGHHQRLPAHDVEPRACQAVLGRERYVRGSSLPWPLYELVKIRTSQLNGCVHRLDMHNRDTRVDGKGQRQMDVLSAWRQAPDRFSEQERTALALTESVTLTGEGRVPDEVRERASKHFGDAGERCVCSWPSPPLTCGTAWR